VKNVTIDPYSEIPQILIVILKIDFAYIGKGPFQSRNREQLHCREDHLFHFEKVGEHLHSVPR
jgi:hypothetical protein